MKPPRPAWRIRRDDAADSGQAMLEFILAFPPVLVIILMIMEFAFYANATHLAQYAAFSAARARLVATDSDAAQAAALAMTPYADAAARPAISADAAAAAHANNAISRWNALAAAAYKRSPALSDANQRILNSFSWQTDSWCRLYKGDNQAASNADFTYVKAGVCFTYPMRIQSLGALSAWIIRLKDRSADDAGTYSLFGGAADPHAPPAPKDYWARADRIKQQSGLAVVPIIKGCMLGKR